MVGVGGVGQQRGVARPHLESRVVDLRRLGIGCGLGGSDCRAVDREPVFVCGAEFRRARRRIDLVPVRRQRNALPVGVALPAVFHLHLRCFLQDTAAPYPVVEPRVGRGRQGALRADGRFFRPPAAVLVGGREGQNVVAAAQTVHEPFAQQQSQGGWVLDFERYPVRVFRIVGRGRNRESLFADADLYFLHVGDGADAVGDFPRQVGLHFVDVEAVARNLRIGPEDDRVVDFVDRFVQQQREFECAAEVRRVLEPQFVADALFGGRGFRARFGQFQRFAVFLAPALELPAERRRICRQDEVAFLRLFVDQVRHFAFVHAFLVVGVARRYGRAERFLESRRNRSVINDFDDGVDQPAVDPHRGGRPLDYLEVLLAPVGRFVERRFGLAARFHRNGVFPGQQPQRGRHFRRRVVAANQFPAALARIVGYIFIDTYGTAVPRILAFVGRGRTAFGHRQAERNRPFARFARCRLRPAAGPPAG